MEKQRRERLVIVGISTEVSLNEMAILVRASFQTRNSKKDF